MLPTTSAANGGHLEALRQLVYVRLYRPIDHASAKAKLQAGSQPGYGQN
jgi:hypothetical protein